MSRKQLKRTTGAMARIAIVGFFILVVACGVGFSAASADSSDDLARAGAFGFDEATHAATKAMPADIPAPAEASQADDGQSALAVAASRDLDAGFAMVDAREEAERQRIAQENAKAVKRMETQKAKQGVVSPTDEKGAPATPETTEYDLPAVDWSVGEEAFLAEWTARIDAYLDDSPLAGYGSIFAQAAWDNGVDPRWSPAISNTESTKGRVCFLPCNAWGWGARSWSDWPTAISDHVAGLAEGYGYSITPDAAVAYCPPNSANWYRNTLAQMRLI